MIENSLCNCTVLTIHVHCIVHKVCSNSSSHNVCIPQSSCWLLGLITFSCLTVLFQGSLCFYYNYFMCVYGL